MASRTMQPARCADSTCRGMLGKFGAVDEPFRAGQLSPGDCFVASRFALKRGRSRETMGGASPGRHGGADPDRPS